MAKIAFSGQVSLPSLDLNTILSLIVASAAIGLGYAAWNIGIIHGNITMLVVASYFTPSFHLYLPCWFYRQNYQSAFGKVQPWSRGSLICWLSTNWAVIRSYFRIN